MAVVLSWLLMIVYITYRFEFNFAVAAVAALVIDVFVTISYFSFFQMELDSSFVAALLTGCRFFHQRHGCYFRPYPRKP